VLETCFTSNGQIFLLNGDTVVVRQNGFDPFWYTTVTFTKNQSSDNGNVQLYVQPCSEYPKKRRIHTNVIYINQSNDESSTFGLGYLYLVKDSRIRFDVNITAHTELSSCAAALYIFQDYGSYSNFLAVGSDTDKATKFCLLISNQCCDHRSSHLFTVNVTSYYFIGLSVPRGSEGVDNVYYRTTGTQLYYTTGNLPLACSIVSGFNSSCFYPLATDTECFLAITVSSPEGGLYLNYSSSIKFNPLRITSLFFLVLYSIGVVIIIIVKSCRYLCPGISHLNREHSESDPLLRK